jgi:hypothetical protein
VDELKAHKIKLFEREPGKIERSLRKALPEDG